MAVSRRSFIARTMAAAGALVAGKSMAATVQAPDEHTLQLATEQAWKLRQLHAGPIIPWRYVGSLNDTVYIVDSQDRIHAFKTVGYETVSDSDVLSSALA